jgi:hypothetical protein
MDRTEERGEGGKLRGRGRREKGEGKRRRI